MRAQWLAASIGVSALALGFLAPIAGRAEDAPPVPSAHSSGLDRDPALVGSAGASGQSSDSPLLDVQAVGVLSPGDAARAALGHPSHDAPFAAPDNFAVQTADPFPFIDVTGSVGPQTTGETPAVAARPAEATEPPHDVGTQLSAMPATPSVATDLRNVMDASDPVLALPLPEAPPPPVIDTIEPVKAAAAATATSIDLADALRTFVSPDVLRRPGESAVETRRRLKTRESIAAFYDTRANAPLWIEANHFSAVARAVLARIDRAAEDGLDLRAYSVPVLRDATPQQLAEAELALSDAVVAYGRQASGGRIDPSQIDPLITAKPAIAEAAEILGTVAGSPDPGAALRDFNPPQKAYELLRTKLAELRRKAAPMAQGSILVGPMLKLGMRDARVPLIRSRFGLDMASANANADGLVYDTKVAAAVADFQRSNGLPASGILTSGTIAALSGGNPARLENELIANMERWRWMPRDLGVDHVDVNIPDYSLEVVRGDTVVHTARVVVGKPDHQTPVFSNAIRFITVNPYWNVPLSIIKKEMMPKLAADPNYFANHGYEVVQRNGMTYVRQPPGDDNALGRIKFMFPNEHSVYLHDTNARALFGKDKRAFSHGCVRVDQPFKLAEVVLGKDNGWSEKRVKAMIGGEERTINLPQPLPIHIMYFTTFVDQMGALQLRDDIYGYSAKVKVALGLRE